MHDTLDPILSEDDLAKWLDTSRPTLQRQRSDGSGPPFVQLSERRIGYRKSAIERWLAARTISRVGALASAKHAPEPAANVTGTVTSDDSENGHSLGARAYPVGPRHRRRAGANT
jgi:predicted DNA-binding transcriptional regulator AlpA